MKPNEAADHEWIRQRKARQKNSTKDKKGNFKIEIYHESYHMIHFIWSI